jgi:RNA polymerase sigma-70 factor, ECF subfamily
MPTSAQFDPLDAILAQSARSGRVDALGVLYARHAEMLYRLAFRMLGDAAEAEDLVQDLFVGLPEALRRYEERGRLDAWLRTVAARMALMRLRARQRTESLHERTAECAAAAEAVPTRLTLERALATLSGPLRMVFTLKVVEGYSHAEIAEMLDIRVGTSEVRLHRATRLLRDLLNRSEP